MIKGIQIAGIFVGLYLIGQTLLSLKRGKYGIKRSFFWVLLWSFMILLFLNPSLVLLIHPILTMQNIVMSISIMSILLIFIFIAHLYQQIADIEKKVTVLVQNLAIHNYIKESFTKEDNESE